MKKPIIKNWIKYWSTTLAVSGMLALGACDSENNNTADNAVDATEETFNTAREDVSQNLEEAEAETEEALALEEEPVAEDEQLVENEQTTENRAIAESEPEAKENQIAAAEESQMPQPAYERTSNTTAGSEPSANSAGDMDAHVTQYEEENRAIKETLTEEEAANPEENSSSTETPSAEKEDDTALSVGEENAAQSQSGLQLENNIAAQESMNDPSLAEASPSEQENQMMDNRAKENNSAQPGINNEQLADSNSEQEEITYENQSSRGLEEIEDPAAPVSIYERHIAIYPEGLSEYAQQRFNEIMSEYRERRESRRGQMDEVTKIYIAPDIDPQPTVGFEELSDIIEQRIEFPKSAAAAEVEGIVLVNVVVDENDKLVKAEAIDEFIESNEAQYPQSFTEQDIQEAKEDLKREAERAVMETTGLWKAGEHNGEKVKSSIRIPISFIVEDTGVGEYKDLGTGVGNPTNVKDVTE